MRHLRAVLLSLAGVAVLAPPPATAQSVALRGVLGSKALLVIDGGTPRALAAGDSLQDAVSYTHLTLPTTPYV